MLFTDQGHMRHPWRVWVYRFQQSITSRWRGIWQVLSQYSGPAMRLHLALFYFYGLYYHWSKRATGDFAYETEQHCTCSSVECLGLCQLFTSTFCNHAGSKRIYYYYFGSTGAVQVALHQPCREILSHVAGVRYIFIGKLFEHRPSYHLLGVLLFMQLGITSASWAIRNVMQSPLVFGTAAKHAAEAQLSSRSDSPLHREQKALVLEASVFDNLL